MLVIRVFFVKNYFFKVNFIFKSLCHSMTTTERDINDLFDEIVLTEERLSKESYEEGFTEGQAQGNLDGYKLGYAQGVQLGAELGEIYGTVVAQLQLDTDSHTAKLRKSLLQLRKAIEEFPRTNDPEIDIINSIESIRTLNKRVRAMLRIPPLAEAKDQGTKSTTTTGKISKEEPKDYTF